MSRRWPQMKRSDGSNPVARHGCAIGFLISILSAAIGVASAYIGVPWSNSSGGKLQGREAGVEAVLGDESVVAAGGDEAAVVHHHDAVRRLDGRQPVGDDQGSAVLHQLLQGPLHRLLA